METPITITITTSITNNNQTATETTIIPSNKQDDRNCSGHMPAVPNLEEDFMLELPKLQSMQLTSSWTVSSKVPEMSKNGHLREGIVDSGFRVQSVINFLQNVTFASGGVRKDTSRTSVQKQGTSRMMELVLELMWWLKIRSRIRMWSRLHLSLIKSRLQNRLVANPTRKFDVIMEWLVGIYELSSIVMRRLSVFLFRMARFLKFKAERPEKDLGSLACIKADEKKLDDIRIVAVSPKYFQHDLLGFTSCAERYVRIVEQSKNSREGFYSTKSTHHGAAPRALCQEEGRFDENGCAFVCVLQDRSSLRISSVESPRRRYTEDRV
ncbi:hypothetical protein Tco_0153147 [Tanacetum coccineum]